MAVGVDAGDLLVVGREEREGFLRPLVISDVPERLAVAERLVALLAVGDGRVVGLERGERAARAVRRVRDEGRDLVDLRVREALLERRHAVPAVAHLAGDGRLVGFQLVEVRADLALRVRGLEGVATGAARAREHLASGGARSGPGAPAAIGREGNCEEEPAAE